jgi:hypothetical protein
MTSCAAINSDRLTDDRPQRERHRDRGVAVVPARCDAARNDGQDRVARDARVTAARDHDPRGRDVGIKRTADLAVAESVPVQTEIAADGPACRAAHDARSGPGALHRWWRRAPPLDVEYVMNDS